MADFQKHIDDFKDRGVIVTAASTDSLEDAEKMAREGQLSFPLGYALNADKVAASHAAFFDERRKFLHATGFLVRADGKISNAVYSTGSIGRLTPADSLRLIDYYQKREINKNN